MINLIPRSAKKKLQLEYWVRALSVWGVLWASALVLGVVALLPAYVLISQQVSIYEASAASASEKVAAYEDVSDLLRTATFQAQDVVRAAALPQFSDFITTIKALEGSGITLNSIDIMRGPDGNIMPILITGIAADRQSLQAFRDSLLAEEWVISVDLPISNLAQGQNINFDITVEVLKSMGV